MELYIQSYSKYIGLKREKQDYLMSYVTSPGIYPQNRRYRCLSVKVMYKLVGSCLGIIKTGSQNKEKRLYLYRSEWSSSTFIICTYQSQFTNREIITNRRLSTRISTQRISLYVNSTQNFLFNQQRYWSTFLK